MSDEHVTDQPGSDHAPESRHGPSPLARPSGGILGWIEWAGNRLPDPAMLFVWALAVTWLLSWGLSHVAFTDLDPRDGKPIVIHNQLTAEALVAFLTDLVTTFTGFHPLGVVLVALLGVGVAEHTGFINAVLKGMLAVTPARLLTPMLMAVGVVSHSAGDTGYVLVIPLGGILFAAAGRHPLAGIACAFAAVSGGFSANFLPSALDPLLAGLSTAGAGIMHPGYTVDILCNYYFTAVSSVLIVAVGWAVTAWVVEPRLRATPVDCPPEEMPTMDPLKPNEVRGLWAGLAAFALGSLALALACWPQDSPLRAPQTGSLFSGSPLMQMIVPLIFLFFLIPGTVYGYVAGTVQSHRDVVKGMTKSMSTMGYYLVLAFCAAQFIYAFGKSNVGVLIAVKGANFLAWLEMPAGATIVGIIVLSCLVNLLIGSASAKWALLAPIFIPMLMKLGLSPELTQAAYRVGDSSTNIVTPLMPYFPLVVAFAQRYVKDTGIGTLIAQMLPYSLTFLLTWTALLLVYWLVLGWPLGPGDVPPPYSYPAG